VTRSSPSGAERARATLYERAAMLRILIVDDSASVRIHLRTLLAPYGRCDEAANGSDAVARCENALEEQDPYQLIIMDLMMPEMDGFTAIQKINALQKARGIDEDDRSRIIIVSCKDDPASIMHAHYETGVEQYLTKPFNKTTLLETLDNMGLLDAAPDVADD
jgi:two-component system, chemotaxis family, chemotaxis protein CheY